MRAFCVTWERRAVGNGCFFSVLAGFERRASNGVKRAFYRAGVKKKRQQTELVQNAAYWGLGDALRTAGKNRRKSCNIKKNPILNGVLSEGKAEMNIYAEDE